MADYGKYTDEKLAAMLQEGSPAAFTAIYERYWHPLWVFAANAMRTEEEAKDLVQDVFSVIWEKHAALQIHTSLKGFLYKTTLRMVIKQVEKTKNVRAFYESLRQELESLPVLSQSPSEDRLAEKELIERFEQLVSGMPTQMKAAFTASRMEEKRYKEIADDMGISKESVKTHIKHALKNLRKGLGTVVFQIFFIFFQC